MVQEKIVLKVEGMTCSNCAQGIARHLEKKGLKGAWVSYENGQVELENSRDFTVSQIIEEVNSLGYKAIDKTNAKKTKEKLFSSLEKKFLIAAVFTLPLLLHMFVNWHWLQNGWLQLFLCLPVLYIGLTFFGRSALGAIRNGQTNMDVLITLGSVSAFLYSFTGLLIATNESEMHQYLFFETSSVTLWYSSIIPSK